MDSHPHPNQAKPERTATDCDRVLIFDTTLRDGEQSPGASMNTKVKLALAVALAALGGDIPEAGFPIPSDGDLQAVQRSPAPSQRRLVTLVACRGVHGSEGS